LEENHARDGGELAGFGELLVDPFDVGDVVDYACILVGSVGIGAFRGDVVDRFTVLALIASDHVDGLLDKVEIEVLI
jgi:hypothetical protein